MGRRQAARLGPACENSREAAVTDDPGGPSLRLYLDTSAIIKLYVEEDASDRMHARRDEAGVVATSLIAYVETRAGLARRRAAGDVSSAEHRRIVEAFDEDWDRLLRIELSERLVADAAALAEKHRLRAYDAVHLASVKALAAEPGDQVTFASWDRTLHRAASHEGLTLLRV